MYLIIYIVHIAFVSVVMFTLSVQNDGFDRMRGYSVYWDLDCSGGGNTDLQKGNMYVHNREDPFAVAVLKNGKVVRHVLLN